MAMAEGAQLCASVWGGSQNAWMDRTSIVSIGRSSVCVGGRGGGICGVVIHSICTTLLQHIYFLFGIVERW